MSNVAENLKREIRLYGSRAVDPEKVFDQVDKDRESGATYEDLKTRHSVLYGIGKDGAIVKEIVRPAAE